MAEIHSVSGRPPLKQYEATVTPAGSLATPGSVVSFQKNVTTAGTAVALGASLAIQAVVIKAKRGNTGDIYVGGSAVSASTGFVLSRGETYWLEVDDLAKVFIDSSVNGEGVSGAYVL